MKRYSAVLGIIGFLDVPLVYWSVTWWAPEITNHPQGLELEPQMKFVLTFSFFTFGLLLLFLLLKRIELSKMRSELEMLKKDYLR